MPVRIPAKDLEVDQEFTFDTEVDSSPLCCSSYQMGGRVSMIENTDRSENPWRIHYYNNSGTHAKWLRGDEMAFLGSAPTNLVWEVRCPDCRNVTGYAEDEPDEEVYCPSCAQSRGVKI